MIFNADHSKYRFKQFITPRVRQISLAIFTLCDLQFTNSFIVLFAFKDNLLTESHSGIYVISELISVGTRLISW